MRNLLKMHQKLNETDKMKYLWMMGKIHVYMWLHTASLKSTAGNKTKFFPCPFRIPTSSCLTLAEAFRNDYIAACSKARRSANEENESGGYVIVPCPSKVTQHRSTADWLNFFWRHQITYDGTHTEQILKFKVLLCNSYWNLLTLSVWI